MALYGQIEALTAVWGRQLEIVNGTPTTRINQDFAPGDTTLHVETTLGFPLSGSLWVHDVLHTYTGTAGTEFTGVATANGDTRYYTYGIRTEVVLHTPSVDPE